MAEAPCTCTPDFCSGESYEDDDPRVCAHCASLDGEWPCPADEEPGEAG